MSIVFAIKNVTADCANDNIHINVGRSTLNLIIDVSIHNRTHNENFSSKRRRFLLVAFELNSSHINRLSSLFIVHSSNIQVLGMAIVEIAWRLIKTVLKVTSMLKLVIYMTIV